MGWLKERLRDAGDFFFGGGLEDDIKDLGRSIDDGVHSLGSRIEDTVKGFAKAIEQDPLKAAAQAAAIYSGQWWALPTVNAIDAAIAGADLEDAVKVAAKTAAIQYITQQVGTYIGESEAVQNIGRDISDYLDLSSMPDVDNSWAEWMDYTGTAIPDADIAAFANLGTNGMTEAAKAVAGGIAGTSAAAVRALMTNQDVPSAILQGIANTSLKTVLSSGLSSNQVRFAPDFVKRALATAGTAGILGESMTSAGSGSLLNDAMAYVGNTLSNKYKDFTEDIKLSLPSPYVDGATRTYIVPADPSSIAQAAYSNFNDYIDQTKLLYKNYEWNVNNHNSYISELETNYNLLTNPTAFLSARNDPSNAWFSSRRSWSDDDIKQELIIQYENAATGLQSVNKWLEEFSSKSWPAQLEKTEAARERFATAIAEATNLDAQIAADAATALQNYEQVANTVARATGVDVSKVDRVQVTNLLNQDKPLEAAYNYAVKTNPNFIANSIKDYETSVAEGKTPDYNAMNVLIRDLSRYDDVKRINPDFNADEYKKLNQLDVANPYEHYLEKGEPDKLVGSQTEANWRKSYETSRLLGQAAELVGVGVNDLSPETREALTTAINNKFSDPRDFKEMSETNLRSWDDVAGLKIAPARLATLKSGEGLNLAVEGSGTGRYAVATTRYVNNQEERRPQTDIDEEIAGANQSLKQQFGQTIASSLRIGTQDDVIEGNGRWVQMPMPTDVTKSRMVYVVPTGDDSDINNIPVDNLTQAQALADAPVSYFNNDEMLRQQFKELFDNAKTKVSPVTNAIINAATNLVTTTIPETLDKTVSPTVQGNAMKAFGGVLQSFNGLVTLAGINPTTTAVGKFAKELTDLGVAKTPAEYQAAVKAMQTRLGDAKGALGAAKAIWGNFTEYPTEFLAEVVGVELLQEAAPLLIGGGASTLARGAALARGMGQKFAQQLGARAGLTAAAISDIAESTGGTAASVFDEAYEIATKKLGMSEADATNMALDLAARSGAFSGIVTAGMLGLGGMAADKAILGGAGGEQFAKAFDTLIDRAKTGAKITIKEGLSEGGEEGVTGAYTESQLYKLDPTRDVAANIATSSILGAIAGGSIAGGAYGAKASTDVIANVLQANPQVQAIVQSAPDAATAQQQLSNLGIDTTERTEILNNRFDDQFVSSQEAKTALQSNTGYVPTAAEIAQFTGQRSEADLANQALAYVDPRVVDESEVVQTLQALGYANPTAEDVAKFIGQRDEATALAAARSEFDPQYVDTAEAQAAFAGTNYQPSAEELASFTGKRTESNLSGDVSEYVDPRMVDEGEARAALQAIGVSNPTPEQVREFVGIASEAGLGSRIDAAYVTKDEAADALKKAGISNPTPEQINQFIGQYPVDDLSGRVGSYADPLVIDRDEAIQALKDAGVTDPTDQDIARVMGETPEEGSVARANQAAIRRVVDEAFKANPGLTNEDVSRIVDDAITALPKAPTEADIKRIVADIVGVPQALPTEEDFKTAQKMAVRMLPYDSAYDYNGDGRITAADALAISKLAKGIDPGYKPSAKFGEGKDWQQPTGLYKEIGEVETGLRKEIKDAIAGIDFPEGITADDVTKAIDDYMKANPGLSLQDVSKAIDTATEDLPTSADVKKNIADALSGYATAKDIEDTENRILKAVADVQAGNTERFGDIDDAIADLRDAGLTEADIQRIVGTPSMADDPTTPDVNEAAPASGLYRDIETAQASATKAIADTETRLGKAIEDAKKEGLAGDAALQKAIDSVAAEQGKSKDALLTALGKSEADLKADFKTQLAVVTEAITDVEGRLTKAIADASAAGLKSDEALQKAIDTVAKDLGTTKTDVLAALGKSEAALKTEFASQLGETAKTLTGELGAVKKELSDAIADAKAAGLKGDEALQAAIGVVAADLGTTKDALLTAIGTTETNLKAEFATQLGAAQEATQAAIQGAEDRVIAKMGEYEAAGVARDTALDNAIKDVATDLGVARTELERQIFGVSELVGRPGRAVTQEDIDFARQMVQPGQQMDLGYDVNRDGRVDDADIKLLESMFQPQTGQPPPPSPGAGSIWAPSGIYAELAGLRQQSAEQAAAQLAATQTAQRQANFGQMMNILSQQPDISGQKVTVKPPDLARIGYTYDWSSIFATPGQEKLFASPYAEGGQVDVDELINILRS